MGFFKELFDAINDRMTPEGTTRIAETEDGKFRYQVYGMNDYEMEHGAFSCMNYGWHTLQLNIGHHIKFKKMFAIFDTLTEAENFRTFIENYCNNEKLAYKRATTVKNVY
jgi:hypothetical protein